MIRNDGYDAYNIWVHSQNVRELYQRRCRRQSEEMTCHAQAADLLTPLVAPGDVVLDAGCGSGYFYHALSARGLDVEYWGIDSARELVEIGREIMPDFGLPADRLQVIRLEDLDGEADHVVCINVLSNLADFRRPMERLLRIARKSVIFRESLAEQPSSQYVEDRYLEEGYQLNVYINTYAIHEVLNFMRKYGFDPHIETDRHTGGAPEMVIDYPHHWTFAVGMRDDGASG